MPNSASPRLKVPITSLRAAKTSSKYIYWVISLPYRYKCNGILSRQAIGLRLVEFVEGALSSIMGTIALLRAYSLVKDGFCYCDAEIWNLAS